MATYQIIITKREANPNLEAEEKRLINARVAGINNDYRRDMERPPLEISTDVLACELTESQFKAVKVEVLKAFE